MLLIHDVFLGNVVQQLVLAAERDSPRDFVDAPDVLQRDLVAADRHHTAGAARRHVLARDAARHVGHARAGHPFRVFQRRSDRARRLVDVAHHAAPHAAVFRESHTQNFRERRARQVARELRNHGARFGAAEIEAGDEMAIGHQLRPPTLRRTTT